MVNLLLIRLPAEAPACVVGTADRSAQAGSLFHTYLSADRQAGEREEVSEAICVRHVFSSLALAERYLPGESAICRINQDFLLHCT